MKVRLSQDDPLSLGAPLLAFPAFEDDGELEGEAARADQVLGGAFSRAVRAGDFRGKEGEDLLFYAPEGEAPPGRLLFIGMGARSDVTAERIRKFTAGAVRRAESLYLTRIAVRLPPDLGVGAREGAKAAAEGGVLAAWDFRELKSDTSERTAASGADTSAGPDAAQRPLVDELTLSIPGDSRVLEQALRTGRAFAEGERLARRLQWLPGNIATPSYLGDIAEGLAGAYGFASHILGPRELEAEGMGAILSVSAGSAEEPRLIVLEHRGGGDDAPVLALVGKGLTFDAGGISIKPALGMEDMKYDMSGGAAVLGAMRAIGELAPPVNVVAVVPSSENLLSGRATKPGDIIRTRAGKSVEVINTDAEGRLILADALSYVVDRYAPDAVVDCATLTGACVIALGHHASAVLGNDEALISELREAGDRAWQRCWPLPLWEPYRKQLESPTADLKNVGGRPAGTITAALFLSEFVGNARWAHLDIAGTAYGDPAAPYQRKGGFGTPTRLLLEWVWHRAGG